MGADINSLPHEVLVRIFHFYLQKESQFNFFNCVSNVCRTWKEVSRNSCFFERLDGTLTLSALVTLAKAGSLRLTRTLKFSKVKQDKGGPGRYQCIYSNMPRLKHIDLTNICDKLNNCKEHAVFTELEGHCPELSELVLSHPDAHCKSKIQTQALVKTLQIRGPNLIYLDVSSANLCGKSIFDLVADNCPNLEEFLAQNLKSITFHRFNTEKFQRGCPKLKTLRLGFPISFARNNLKDAIGFPDLEIFTHPSRDDYVFRSTDLEAILCQSPNLKILDLRGCVLITFQVIQSLPATDLEQIYLSWLKPMNNTGIIKILQKWSHSLNILDVSHIKGKFINEMFSPQHLPNGLPNLEVLDVNNTSITSETLMVIIQQFPKLNYLNLESCHGLIRGTRQIYRSRSEIEKLLAKIEKFEEMELN